MCRKTHDLFVCKTERSPSALPDTNLESFIFIFLGLRPTLSSLATVISQHNVKERAQEIMSRFCHMGEPEMSSSIISRVVWP